MAWATDSEGPPVYLLSGMAGAGKSAIARSFARLLDQEMLLGASFFCSRGSESRSNATAILPTLAFHLAWKSEPYARALIKTIKTNPGVTFNLRTPSFQFTKLLLQPAQVISQLEQILVVVIDAVDECSGANSIQALLKVLTQSTGVRQKFFITGRPEPYIEKAVDWALAARRLHLRDVEHEIVTADVTKYLRTHLRTLCPGWPSENDLKELVHRTGHFFIFAFTVIQYLSSKWLSHAEVERRLQNILDGTASTKNQTVVVDALYGQILDDAWSRKDPDEQAARKDMLATIICLREPLPLGGLSGLTEKDPETVTFLLADFHSVIDFSGSLDTPIQIFHASFPDYVTNNTRSGDKMLVLSDQHAVLALQCIKCMNSSLRHNLCTINREDSIQMITEDILNRSIPPHLRYASVYWGTHLSLIPIGTSWPELASELQIWANKHILNWIECLAITGKLHVAVDALRKAIIFCSVRMKDEKPAIVQSDIFHRAKGVCKPEL
jgi:hypothetical protein